MILSHNLPCICRAKSLTLSLKLEFLQTCLYHFTQKLIDKKNSSWNFSQTVFISYLAKRRTSPCSRKKVCSQFRMGLSENQTDSSLSHINPITLSSWLSRPSLNNLKEDVFHVFVALFKNAENRFSTLHQIFYRILGALMTALLVKCPTGICCHQSSANYCLASG